MAAILSPARPAEGSAGTYSWARITPSGLVVHQLPERVRGGRAARLAHEVAGSHGVSPSGRWQVRVGAGSDWRIEML